MQGRVFVGVFLAGILAAAPIQAQVLLSDNFEDGNLDGWTVWGDPLESLAVVNLGAQAHGGSFCVSNVSNVGGTWYNGGRTSGHGQFMTTVIPSEGQYLRITIWTRTHNPPAPTTDNFDATDWLQIDWRRNPTDPWTSQRWTDWQSSGDWVARTFALWGSTSFELRIGVNTNTNASGTDPELYLIDDVLVEATPPPLRWVRRTINPLTFTPGSTATVGIELAPTLKPDGTVGGSVDVITTDRVALDLSISNVSHGGTVNGRVILWNVTVSSTTTLTYDVKTSDILPNDRVLYALWLGRYTDSWVYQQRLMDTGFYRLSDPIPAPTGASGWWTNTDITPNWRAPGYGAYYNSLSDYYLMGDGTDIWGTADEGRFLLVWVLGDFSIEVEAQQLPPAADANEKIGPVVRANLTPGSPFVYLLLRQTDDDIVASERVTQGGSARRFANRADGTDPNTNSRAPNSGTAILRLSRTAPPGGVTTTIWVGYDNGEGDSRPQWYSSNCPNIPYTRPVLLGMAYTSHDINEIDRARFRNVTITGNVVWPTIESAERVFAPTEYTSAPIHMRINLKRYPGQAGIATTVTETIPEGWTASSGTLVGTTLTFLNVTGDVVEYDLYPSGSRFPGNVYGAVTGPNNFPAVAILPDASFPPADRMSFQQGVYPTASYAGTDDCHITWYNAGGGVWNNIGARPLMEEGDSFGIENPYHAANPNWDYRPYPGFDDNKLLLVRFDLSGHLPTGTIVDEAWLRLYFDYQRRGLTSGSVTIQPVDHYTWGHVVAKAWNEGQGVGTNIDGSDAYPGEVSWIAARAAYEDWATSGVRGLTDILPPSQFETQSHIQYGRTPDIWIQYNVSDIVQYWLNNPAGNFGLKISQDDQGTSTSGYHFGLYVFPTSEDSRVLLRPTLTVKFLPSMHVERWSLYR